MIAADSVIVCWAMGLTQHQNAVATIREIVNFLLLRGNIGRPGAGPCPVRGHSNVQGDRTMGIWEKMPDALPRPAAGRVRLRAAARARLRHGRLDPGDARRQGRTCSSASAATSSRPRRTRDVTAAALAKCPLTVHVSTKLNRSHLLTGRAGADPAVPRPHRARRSGGRRAVRHRRGLDEHGARVDRAAGARVGATAQRGGDHHRDRGGTVRRGPRVGRDGRRLLA